LSTPRPLADALAVEDHGAARPAQRLVRRGRDHVRVLEGRRHDARGHEARDVRHVGHEHGRVLIADGAHAGVVNVTRVGTRASYNELGAEQRSVLLEAVVVDQTRVLIQAVRHALEEDGRGRDLLVAKLVAVRQVSAVRQVQRHDALVRR